MTAELRLGLGRHVNHKRARGIGLVRLDSPAGPLLVQPPWWSGPGFSGAESFAGGMSDDWVLQTSRSVSDSLELSLYETPTGVALVLRGERTITMQSILRPASYAGLADGLAKAFGTAGLALDAYSVAGAFVEGWSAYEAADGLDKNAAFVEPVARAVGSAGGAYLGGAALGTVCGASGFATLGTAGCVFVGSAGGSFIGGYVGSVTTASGCFVLDAGCAASRLTQGLHFARG